MRDLTSEFENVARREIGLSYGEGQPIQDFIESLIDIVKE